MTAPFDLAANRQRGYEATGGCKKDHERLRLPTVAFLRGDGLFQHQPRPQRRRRRASSSGITGYLE